VRARNKTENIKIFLTGSSAKLMSREIATLLTGRHLTFEIMPLSFAEFLKFQQIALPEHKRPIAPPALIKTGLHDYQKWGGFPAVTLADSHPYYPFMAFIGRTNLLLIPNTECIKNKRKKL